MIFDVTSSIRAITIRQALDTSLVHEIANGLTLRAVGIDHAFFAFSVEKVTDTWSWTRHSNVALDALVVYCVTYTDRACRKGRCALLALVVDEVADALRAWKNLVALDTGPRREVANALQTVVWK